jgi:glycosyltransferase 2 family protein
MIRLAALFGLAGLALATGLIAWQGIHEILAALAVAGIGILWASLFHIVPMALNAAAWQALLPGASRPGLVFFTWAVWVREAVNGLLPVARIGGELVSVRLLTGRGVRTGPAVASLVVDMMLCILVQFFYTVLGLWLLLGRTDDSEAIGATVAGLLVMVPIIGGLALVQRLGFFELLARVFRTLFGHRFDHLVRGAAPLDKAVRLAYRRPRRILLCFLWQAVAWVVSAGEIWLALYYLGHPVRIADAILIDAITLAVSSAGFIVPGAIGIQEGAFLVIGQVLGLPPEVALALALARRARDLILFLPALLAWQVAEGKRWLAVRPA